jgi:hypothetical protein
MVVRLKIRPISLYGGTVRKLRHLLYWLADRVNENRRLRARVVELLKANNEELERRRQSEADCLRLYLLLGSERVRKDSLQGRREIESLLKKDAEHKATTAKQEKLRGTVVPKPRRKRSS